MSDIIDGEILPATIFAEYLAKLKCTRIVVAHRLSTVKHCDRIMVIDHGTIAEE